MLKYFAVKRKGPEVAEAAILSEVVESVLDKVVNKKKRSATSWAQWPRDKKEAVAKDCLQMSWASLQVFFSFFSMLLCSCYFPPD